jgi:uncharacterized protein YdeI (YjbR/CyaY-like superfamily)
MITQIDDYFTKGCGRCPRFGTSDCSTRHWHDGLVHLRRICCATGLTESVKWGHPCYQFGDRNIALIGAFRGDFRLNFMNAALLSDPHHVLERQGPNTRHASILRFTDTNSVVAMAPIITSYLEEAIGFAKAGIKPAPEHAPEHATEPADIDLPEELIAALDDDPELSEAFHALTPGRQRSYVINLTATKNPTTRFARITKFRDRIVAGKGANER